VCTEHDDGNRKASQILLEGQVSVDCDEDIELLRCKGKQRSVLDRRPTHLSGAIHFVPDDLTHQPPIDTLVEKHLHETDLSIRSFAPSRKAITCSRVTDVRRRREPENRTLLCFFVV
jgi:hypothetical protein